jgi:hypothetical protein
MAKAKPTDRSIQPRLVPSAIREPAVSAADGNIENKVESYHNENGLSVSFKKSLGRPPQQNNFGSCNTYADRKERNFRGPPKGLEG